MRKKLNKKKSPLLDEIEQRRIVSILFVVALLFIILFVKLYVVMIVDSSKYKKKLDDDRKRKIRCAYFAEYLPMVRHFQGMYWPHFNFLALQS